jgi:hypothetical protein
VLADGGNVPFKFNGATEQVEVQKNRGDLGSRRE